MNVSEARVMVLAPGGAPGIGAVAAAGRAGALGLLDLTSAGPEAGRRALARASTLVDRPFGVLAGTGGIGDEPWPDRLAVVACRGDRETDWRLVFDRVKARGRRAMAEVVDRRSAAEAVAAGASGLIVSGLEAGGRCGDESSFVLLQGVLADHAGAVPVWVRGGIGPESASACLAAGAAGVVLDGAVLLARESALSDEDRARIARLDGGETAAIGPPGGPCVRVDAPPGSAAVARLREAARIGGDVWREAMADNVGWGPGQARPIGQDGAFAAPMARRAATIGGIVRAVEGAIDEGLALARQTRPLAPGSPMATALGTRYPIVQGPMTRVSDSAGFALAVAEGGALPMLALAMLRGPEAAALLAETAERLAGRPWGVGVLGFVDPSLRAEQLEAIRAVRPPFALIAGGRPDQAEAMEREGIRTFLHAPSPALMSQYLRDGARRFVLEGRECGGHVGPRSSLVLWGQAVAAVREAIEAGSVADPAEMHLLFAGGVHDARSAAAVSALAAPLASRGVKVGVLAGTAYLFTEEAVGAGAITTLFQAEAIRCRETVLLPTGPGHEVRAVPSPYTERFAAERRRLVEAGAGADEVREALERLNVGRLRVASKGVDRAGGPDAPLVPLDEREQRERGLFMIGQVAALRDRVTTVVALHAELSEGSTARLDAIAADPTSAPAHAPSDVAIVGMSALFPGAADLRTFWENTLKGVDAIVEVPPDRWDWRTYYDPDGKGPDAVVSKWGGFLPDVAFDPLRYGMPPASLPSIEPAQLLVLEAVRAALDDAGYADRPFPRERTAVVLGMGGGAAQLAMGYAFRSYLPMLDSVAPDASRAVRERAAPLLPEWTEDSFPGFLLNVTAGRVANRFGLGGANYTVDAACGSSLAAASLAVRELESGAADMVVLGGADTVQNPFTYLAFSKTHAFSPRGRCRPFDASADGIVISEGVGVVVLKRLADAERDGDRIYAVIKGVGSSSDGRARGLTAPSGEGQRIALSRAYARAGIRPSSVGYVEAHGTGTAVGDVVEVNALAEVLRADGAAPASVAVGSVKSMIGHTKCAAGLAGLINATLALSHRVLPPTIGVEALNPSADLEGGPLRVSTKARPWLSPGDRPRRAGVSAFGFGGTNFHLVLESYEADATPRPDPMRDWPAELLVWREADRPTLLDRLDRLGAALDGGAAPRLNDLAHSLIRRLDPEATDRPTLAIVASSIDDLRAKLRSARGAIARGDLAIDDPKGIAFADRPPFAGSRAAFLFPGQGAQRLEMLGDLALAFEEVRGGYEGVDAALIADGREPVSPRVFPPPTLDDAARERARLALCETAAAQPAVAAAEVGMLRLLRALGVEADAVAGHSFGELVALHAAGSIDLDGLARLSEARGRLMAEAAGPEPGAMVALLCDADRADGLIVGIGGVVLANRNGPKQSVIAGPRDNLNRAVDRARAAGVRCVDLPVGAAFHSPIVAPAQGPMAALAASAIATPPRVPVFSNLDAAAHPADPAEIARRLGDQLASPVRFAEMIEAMARDGVRVFVECGPGATLAGLVRSILGDRPHLAVSCDAPGRPGIPTLLLALARLVAAGVPARRLDRLTSRRGAVVLDPDHLPSDSPRPSPTTWLVNGSRARPIDGPEPKRLGMAPELLGVPAPDRSASSPANGGWIDGGKLVDMIAVPEGRGSGDFAIAAPRSNGHHDRDRDDRGPRSPVNRLHDAQARTRPGPERTESMTQEHSTNGHHRNGHAPNPERRTTDAGRADGRHAEVDRAMAGFQETMRAFLAVQRETMLAYLTGRGGPAHSAPQPDGHPGTPIDSQGRADSISEWEHPRPSDRQNGHATRSDEGGITSGNGFHHQSADARPDGQRTPSDDGAPSSRAGLLAAVSDGPETGVPADPEPAGRSVADVLIRIVCDRTGYPAEMLGMGLDLEADLGIDSIKRVEILGTLRDAIAGLGTVSGSDLMDRLARAKTLGEIVDRVESALADGRDRGGEAPHPPGPPTVDQGGLLPSRDDPSPPRPDQTRPPSGRGPTGPQGIGGPSTREDESGRRGHGDDDATAEAGRPPTDPGGRPRRLMLEPVTAPRPESRSGFAPGGVVLVTDDGRGVARAVADALRADGSAAEIIGPGWGDFGSPGVLENHLSELKLAGPIAGIIHAQPLGDFRRPGPDGPDLADLAGDGSVRGLFLLARAAADDLERSARLGGACVVAATGMGGAFSSAGQASGMSDPGHGGVAGLVKTLAREWPAVRARVVDLDPAEPPRVLADRLLAEATTDDRWPEVGYKDGRRVRLRPVDRPLRPGPTAIEIRPGEPILVTGGARGITASVAVELARRWRPRLLLIGSGPLPEGDEDPETTGLESVAELKAALLDRLRRRGADVSPADVQDAYRALVRAREVRETLARIRRAGAEVEYARADVRDGDALGRVVDGWRLRFGEPVGLIHGAGVIQDRRIREKTPSSFDRVFGTKLDGAMNLVRLLRGDALRFSALFSSIAGRFGNEGQADYAAANDALNKLALWLDRRWPGRVVSVNWGPWSRVGMVSDLERHLGRRGLGMIEPGAGASSFADELAFGRKGEVEVILSGDLGPLDGPLPAAEAEPEGAVR